MTLNMAGCIIKVVIGLYLASPTFCSPLLSPSIPLRASRLSNSLNPHGEDDGALFEPDWVLISKPPPRVVQQTVGARLELECEAMGANPMIQWVRGDSPLTENESYESNSINEALVQGVSTIKSRLIINSLLPPHQGLLSCVANSGLHTAVATTELYVLQGAHLPLNFSSLLTALPLSAPRARIVLWNSSVMRPQGSDVIVPCRVVGNPHPEVFWLDQEERVVGQGGEGERMQVLPGGELRIKDLKWQDMGPYTCVARNAFSKDSVSTFIYPLLKEN